MLRAALPEVHAFEAIGTHWQIETARPLPASVAAAIADRIERFDATWSRFRSDSTASRLRHGGGSFVFPAEAEELFALYDALVEATGGGVSPFVGAALEDLGYDPAYSLVPSAVPTPAPSWAAARRGAVELVTAEPVVLDVGAAGKGLLVDLVAAILDAASADPFVVDAGGDLRGRGLPDYRVALEHPYDATRAIGIATPGDRALCASATNRRTWGDGLHHVLDGRTGRPVPTVAATWVVAETALLADGLATALFLQEPERLAERFAFDYVRVRTDGTLTRSSNFPGEVFR